MTETTSIDGLTVGTGAEAEALCLHHLRIAALLFEATDEDFIAKLPGDEFSLKAMTAWVAAMDALYPAEVNL